MRIRSTLLALAFFAGCSVVVSHRILQPVTDCVGADPGVPCEGGDYCYADQCRYSFCGDGILNRDRGEECDDGNLVAGDGCEPTTCRHGCDADTPCPDDANVCNGPESCEATSHVCVSGPWPDTGFACAAESGASGACVEGLCVLPGCGDGAVDPASEECEPPTPGCMVNCHWECESDLECPMSDPCVESRHCDLAAHACVSDGPLACDDHDPCTADSCSSGLGGCSFAPVDADGDRYAPLPLACAPGGPLTYGDCDDRDSFVNPAAVEVANGRDDDCDGEIDEGTVTVVCYLDKDGDRFGRADESVGPVSECPPDYVPARGDRFDCDDANRTVNPGLRASEFFEIPYCPGGGTPVGLAGGAWTCPSGVAPSFDYDCDKVERPRSSVALPSCRGHCGESGWSLAAPPCGGHGQWLVCGTASGTSCRGIVGDDLAQSCR